MLGYVELPKNSSAKFSPSITRSRLSTAFFLQWHSNRPACRTNVSDVHVLCTCPDTGGNNCTNPDSALIMNCAKTNQINNNHNLCSQFSAHLEVDPASCQPQCPSSMAPINSCPSLSVTTSTSTIQYSPPNITSPLTFQSTSIIHDSLSTTSTISYSSTSMSFDLLTSMFPYASPSPTSLYCPPDPPWPRTQAGCDAPLNRTCHYGIYKGQFNF